MNTHPLKGETSGHQHEWAVILAGGDGSRLKSLTRHIAGDERPKQFCSILGRATLLEETQRRAALEVEPQRTLCVVNRAHEPTFGTKIALNSFKKDLADADHKRPRESPYFERICGLTRYYAVKKLTSRQTLNMTTLLRNIRAAFCYRPKADQPSSSFALIRLSHTPREFLNLRPAGLADRYNHA